MRMKLMFTPSNHRNHVPTSHLDTNVQLHQVNLSVSPLVEKTNERFSLTLSHFDVQLHEASQNLRVGEQPVAIFIEVPEHLKDAKFVG